MVLYGGGDAGLLATVRSRHSAVSQLEARRGDGSLAWRTPLTFLATQPPVDGGDRVYVIGAGIAALDLTGRVLWSSSSGERLRVQAFADGTLAVVRGRVLEIVSAEGNVRQSFMAGEELTTYPAIDADGQVWVASAKTLYRTRS
jgi:outer membrane protein assembly factor BamB